MLGRRLEEQPSSLSSTWKLLTQTAGFVSTVTNRWFQEREDEEDTKEQILIERDIQKHLDCISQLLLEQESADDGQIKQLDLAVKHQLNRIQELLEETRERKQQQQTVTARQVAYQDVQKGPTSARTNAVAPHGLNGDLMRSAERSPSRRLAEPEILTKLFSKVRHNRYKEVEAILDNGVSPDVRDQYGNTLIILACQNGNKRIAKICLRKNCDIDAQNYRGQTALHYCYAFGYHELGEYLQSKGARDDITNESMMTCYDGLEPSEVRLDTNMVPGSSNSTGGGGLDRAVIGYGDSLRSRRQRSSSIRIDPRSVSGFDDDTESLTSTASGFSTDTTTDTYPSCASPTLPSLDLETPARRTRHSINTHNWLRHAADLGQPGGGGSAGGRRREESGSSESPSAAGDLLSGGRSAAARRRQEAAMAAMAAGGQERGDRWLRESGEGEGRADLWREEGSGLADGQRGRDIWREEGSGGGAAAAAASPRRVEGVSIEELAEGQAQQLEALAHALRALKSQRHSIQSIHRSVSEPLPPHHPPPPPNQPFPQSSYHHQQHHAGPAPPAPPAASSSPLRRPFPAAAAQGEAAAARSAGEFGGWGQGPYGQEEGPAGGRGSGGGGMWAQRQGVVQPLRASDPEVSCRGRAKPAPPPLPPPPSAKRILWPVHLSRDGSGGAGGSGDGSDVESPAAGVFSPYGRGGSVGAVGPAGPPQVVISPPAGGVRESCSGGEEGGASWSGGDNSESLEDEDLLSARLTCRAALQPPQVQPHQVP